MLFWQVSEANGMASIVLVTGSSGMIGTALCEKLLEKGFEVIGVDLMPNRWSQPVNKKTILVDLRNANELKRLSENPVFQKPDFFVHLAANPYVFNSVQNPLLAVDNVLMTMNCLEFCRENAISRFLFASSREIYGNVKKKSLREPDFRLENVESPYAASKVAGESFVRAYHKCFGIDFEMMRFSNVYGRYDLSDRLLPRLFRKNRDNEDFVVFGEEKALSFTYLDDVVEGILLGIRLFEKAKNREYNIAFPKATRIVDVVKLLQKKMASKNKIIVGKTRIGEVENFCPDISLARNVLGFNPKIGIEEGLEKALEWYSKHS